MSKQDIVDYVMETPQNTNRTVLEGLVDTTIEESQVQPDWSQNDPEAKDYIKNRPGGYYFRIPVLGLLEDQPLSGDGYFHNFGITFIGEDDFDTFDRFDTTLILHFFEKEFPISFDSSNRRYLVHKTINDITIIEIQYNYYSGRYFWTVQYSAEKDSILHPSDFYITKRGAIPFDNDIMPQATQEAFGALKPYDLSVESETYWEDDYQQCYQLSASYPEANGRLVTKKQVQAYFELTPEIILDSCLSADSYSFIANFYRASDEVKELLDIQDKDLPMLVYFKDTVYSGGRPTYTLGVIAQTGKHGTFTIKRSTKEMSAITWNSQAIESQDIKEAIILSGDIKGGYWNHADASIIHYIFPDLCTGSFPVTLSLFDIGDIKLYPGGCSDGYYRLKDIEGKTVISAHMESSSVPPLRFFVDELPEDSTTSFAIFAPVLSSSFALPLFPDNDTLGYTSNGRIKINDTVLDGFLSYKNQQELTTQQKQLVRNNIESAWQGDLNRIKSVAYFATTDTSFDSVFSLYNNGICIANSLGVSGYSFEAPDLATPALFLYGLMDRGVVSVFGIDGSGTFFNGRLDERNGQQGYTINKLGNIASLNASLSEKQILISSSTPDSTKKFKITVDDTGTLTATEVTEASETE